jgi:ADP-ribosylglycohydrolase
MATIQRRERVEGGLVGLLVGDALGVPYEFHPPQGIPPPEQIEFVPPSGFQRAHAGVPPGTWSDDGAQALALLSTLLDHGRFDANDFGQRLVTWYERGVLAVGGKVFDVGIQTAQAIRVIMDGAPAAAAGSTDERTNGNGALMRVLPLALWHHGTDAELVADAHAQSRVTHGHLRSQICCALYCLWARQMLADHPEPWRAAVATLRDLYRTNAAAQAELEFSIRPDDPPEGRGSGYVVDCLRSARLVLEAGVYAQVVKAAVALGNDTDTTACVAGGIAGVRDGVHAIPERWRGQLCGVELLAPLRDRLLDWCDDI